MVKRLILIIAAIILALSLLSCRSIQYAMINEEETAETHFQKIAEALENRDKEGLKKLFAPNALKEAKDLESGIDSAMELYKGRMKSKDGATTTADSKNDGVRTKEMECSYKVVTDAGRYRIYFIDKLVDSKDSGNVGIYMIKVVKDTKEPEYFYWGDGTESPGIFCETEKNVEVTSSPESQSATVSLNKISEILSTKNVIDTLGLMDSDLIKSFNGSDFYEPVFRCKKLGVLIGFNGAPYDTVEKLKEENETPNFIIPDNETIIDFGGDYNFRVGDNITQFTKKFGKGKTGTEGNLKGDEQSCILTYNINNLEIRFTSLEGDDFKKYDVYISKCE